jgi:hypothetical protein
LIQLRGIIDDIHDLPTTKPILNRIDKFKNMFWVASQRKKETCQTCHLRVLSIEIIKINLPVRER